MKFSQNTNKKPLLRAVTFSRQKVYRKVARLKTFSPPLVNMFYLPTELLNRFTQNSRKIVTNDNDTEREN